MIRKITKDQPLKILGFTDTHLDHYEASCNMTFKIMQETIEAEKPDTAPVERAHYNKQKCYYIEHHIYLSDFKVTS